MPIKLPEFLKEPQSKYEDTFQNQVDYPDRKSIYKNKLKGKNKRFKLKFIDKGLIKTSKILKVYFDNITYFGNNNFLTKINPKIKIFILIFILLLISFANMIEYQIIISLFLIFVTLIQLLYFKENTGRIIFIKKILYPTILFGFLLSFPASLNIITKGEPIINLINLKTQYEFWIYKIPEKIFISKEGLNITFLITLRVFNSVCISILILQTEPIEKLINSLKVLKVPVGFRLILLMTQKYILSFSRVILGHYLSLRSRLFTRLDKEALYQLTGTRAFLLYKKTKDKLYGITLAMKSRGLYNL